MLSRELDGDARVTRFSVADTGRGIRAEDQERLFAAFEHVDGDGARSEGTGLGLYIYRTLAPMIGGSITFESELGVGSSFALSVREAVIE